MALSISSPVSGTAVTGFTSPTFTLTADFSDSKMKQWVVSAVGGTHGNGSAKLHSLSNPFTVTLKRPASLRNIVASMLTAVGLVSLVKNEYKLIVRKCEQINGLGGYDTNMISCSFLFSPATATQSPGTDDVNDMLSIFGGIAGSATFLNDLRTNVIAGTW